MKCASSKTVENSRQRVVEMLHGASMRCTSERKMVLTTLIALQTPCTVDELRSQLPTSVNKVTLYRMLEQFAEAGFVERVMLHDGTRRYEYQDEHHHHITCTACGMRRQVAIGEQAIMRSVHKSATDFASIVSHTIEFYGLCTRCAR